jgi:hypothetical protein
MSGGGGIGKKTPTGATRMGRAARCEAARITQWCTSLGTMPWPTPSGPAPAHRGRVGVCGPRRSSRPAFHLGQRSYRPQPTQSQHVAGRVSGAQYGLGPLRGTGSREVVCCQRLQFLRLGWQRVGVVRQLVVTQLLPAVGEPVGPGISRPHYQLRPRRTDHCQARCAGRLYPV